MPVMKSSKAIFEALLNEDVRTLFTIPGSHVFELLNEFYERTDFKLIYPKYEQSASTMADAYGRLTGEPGVCLVTAGPGATNGLSGVAQAYQAGSPMVHVSGNVPTKGFLQDFHGVDDRDFIAKAFHPVTKMSVRITDGKDIPKVFAQAFHVARSGRKGPVHIDVPVDVLASEADVEEYWKKAIEQHEVNEALIKESASVLAQAQKPAVYIADAASVSATQERLLSLIETLQAPFIISEGSIGFLPQDHALYGGMVSRHWDTHPIAEQILREADVLLLVGLRMNTPFWDYVKKNSSASLIHLYVEETSSGSDSAQSIIGDLNRSVSRLTEEVGGRQAKKPAWFDLREKWRKVNEDLHRIIQDGGRPIHPGVTIDRLSKHVTRDTVVTGDVGNVKAWLEAYLATRVPCRYLGAGSWGAMGFAIPAAIGAKALHPDGKVVAVCGDGGFLMSCMELATIAENRMKMVVVVLNDAKWGMNWQFQKRKYQERFLGVDIHSPNFAKFAESFGLKGVRVEDPVKLSEAYEEAFSSNTATVIDVATDHSPSYPFGKFPA
ncbi:MAG: thiamine pyrophosphate-binding protein [Thaumarchaeota archaeon]|nr:thiamine pyrophosphate-binding protein [Nitrososphaerota archaeon]